MGRLRMKGLLVLAVVAALHLWLLMLLQGALRGPPAPPPSEPAPVILVRALPPPAALRETLPEAPREPAPRPARSTARPAPVQAALPEPAASASAQATAAPETTAAAAPAASAAASAPPGGLLDTEATRRAIREAARRPSTAEMGAQATDAEAPLSGQQRMGQEIARGARGDCLKGEFAGSGMGLLSLPFWLIAEMREKCRR
jgi:type IV secretory pathway VirB10-like protein